MFGPRRVIGGRSRGTARRYPSLTWPSRADLGTRTDPGEGQDVVGEGREDRVAEEVLRVPEAVEVPGAVRRPARPDEERHDRQVVEEDALQLCGVLMLLRRVQRALPLVEQLRGLRVGEVNPVAGRLAALPRGDVRVLGQVRVEEPVRRALRRDLPEERRELRRVCAWLP